MLLASSTAGAALCRLSTKKLSKRCTAGWMRSPCPGRSGTSAEISATVRSRATVAAGERGLFGGQVVVHHLCPKPKSAHALRGAREESATCRVAFGALFGSFASSRSHRVFKRAQQYSGPRSSVAYHPAHHSTTHNAHTPQKSFLAPRSHTRTHAHTHTSIPWSGVRALTNAQRKLTPTLSSS